MLLSISELVDLYVLSVSELVHLYAPTSVFTHLALCQR